MTDAPGRRRHRARVRFVAMVIVGLIGAGITVASGAWAYAAIVGWAAAASTYIVWVWWIIGRMDSEATARHASFEDPSRATVELLLLLASVASLAAVTAVLVQAHSSQGTGRVLLAALAVLSVALSWGLVHTLFTLRYASLYYGGTSAGGVDFNQFEAPRYSDFAYLSFTIGMTFQVSDTNLQSSQVRTTALRHGLMSYLFGTVILATLINLVAGFFA
ncbi:MAG: DUF1345 domain-containing protein [Microbacteriaceae bacterium]